MKFVSNRISGVKNFVSSTGLLRVWAFIQLKSPNANGVKLSTPGGGGRGAEQGRGRTEAKEAEHPVRACRELRPVACPAKLLWMNPESSGQRPKSSRPLRNK